MPTYEYRCKACEHAFDLVQSMTAPVKRKCPECGKLQLERLIGVGAGFIIKGGAASAKTEAAEKAADETARKKAKESGGKPEKAGKPNAASKSDAAAAPPSDDSSTSSDSTPKKPDTKKPADPPERKISGATSTPTHAAREGRGVGNLVDQAKRRAKEASPKKSRKPRQRPSK